MNSPDPGAAPAPLRRNRSFRVLWSGYFAAQLGTGMGAVAYPVVILEVGGTPALTGVITFAAGTAAVAARLPCGAAADRYDRRRLMFGAQMTRAAAMGTLAVGLFTGSSWVLWLVAAVAVVDTVGHEAYRFAERAALRHIVHQEQLPDAVGQNEARNQVAALIGPALGGWTLALGRSVPFGLAALGHLLSGLGLFLIRERLQTARDGAAARRPGLRDLRPAFTWIAGRPEIRVLLLGCVAPNLVVGGVTLAVIMRAGQEGAGGPQIGTVLAVAGLGGGVGALAAPRLMRSLSPRTLYLSVLWALPPMVLALAPLAGHWSVVFPLAVILACAPMVNVLLGTYQLLTAPDHLQARVGSACTLITGLAAPLGPLIAGFGLQYGGVLPLFAAFAAFLGLVATLISLMPSSRLLANLPDGRHVPVSPMTLSDRTGKRNNENHRYRHGGTHN